MIQKSIINFKNNVYYINLFQNVERACKTNTQKHVGKRITFVIVQALSHVQLFVIPGLVAFLASLFSTVSRSLLKLMSIESVMLSNPLIFCCPLLLCLQSFPTLKSFLMSQLFSSGGQITEASASASVLQINIQGSKMLM